MQDLTHKYGDFSATFAGILLILSFAPFDYSCLALAALIILFGSWQNVSAGRAAFRGYLFGLGSFGFGVSWVYISIHDYGRADFISAGMLTFLFVGFWALFPALAGYLSVKLMSLNRRFIYIPVIWILIEYLRGYLVLNGFPWLQIAYSQLETPLAGYIPVVGAYGTGFLLALTASSFAGILRSGKRLIWVLAGLAAIWGIGGLLQTIKWTYEIDDPLRVSLIQGNISQDQKWLPENRISTLIQYRKMTEQHWDSDIIIWPETAIPAYLSEVKEPFLEPLSKEAKQNHTDLIISVPIKENGHKNYNAVITLGKEEGIYRKSHLLPFGEYLPWQPLSGFILQSLNIKLGDFTAGSASQSLLRAGGYPFITSICYEDAFGDINSQRLSEAAYLVNVTNDAWFGDSLEPHQHLQIARMRAKETGRYLLRATNTGVTAIVSPEGKIAEKAPSFKATVLTGKIMPMRGVTPYVGLGNRPIIYVLAILLFSMMMDDRFLAKSDRRVEAI
ncbi:MAG: apolipoprotein N-acyltransferase [Methylobacter sp.]|nr:apolipoprotein N-acyltransferase [Methylobacter sp.]